MQPQMMAIVIPPQPPQFCLCVTFHTSLYEAASTLPKGQNPQVSLYKVGPQIEPPCNCRYINQKLRISQTYLKPFFSPRHSLTCYEPTGPCPGALRRCASPFSPSVHLKACQHPLEDAAVHTILDGLRKLQGASWMFQDLRLYKYPKQLESKNPPNIQQSMPSFKAGTVNLSLFQWDFAILLSFWG